MRIIGYTTGVFDLFHIGHLNILRRAKMECDYLIVGVTTDDLAITGKNTRPVISFTERIEIVQNIRFVDEAIPQDSYDKYGAWEILKFDKVFVGDDWKGSERWQSLEQRFSAVGVEVVYFPYTQQTSSTQLRRVLEVLSTIGKN